MNEIEKELLEIIVKISYKDKENSIIENREYGIKFPLSVDVPPNYRVINTFNTYYFDKYKYCLFENALIYAYSIKDKSYIDYYTSAIKNKEDIELADSFYLMKTTEFAVLNIQNKQYKKNVDKKIKSKYKHSFDKLNKLFVSIQTITQFCRKQIIEFVNLFPSFNCNDILYTLINTNKLDSDFIKFTNNQYNQNTLVSYKKLLCMLILSDNYLSIKALEIEDELDEHIDDLLDNYSDYNSKEINEEEINEETDLYNKEIIVNYIEESVKNNNIRIPTDTELLSLMFTNFFNYNECELCKEYDIDMIEQDAESLAILKKVNPLYKFDCFDSE